MPIPKTLSAPSDSTFPALKGFAPSIEDRVRYAVWLMMYSDDVLRREYSYDEADASKGVRIRQEVADYDNESGGLILPQMGVYTGVSAGAIDPKTSMRAENRVVIVVMHYEAPTTARLETDVTIPMLTYESKLARTRAVLMRGTIFEEDQNEEATYLVDAYASPLLPDGGYDPAQIVTLTTQPPAIRPTVKRSIPNRTVKSEAEYWKLDPIRDYAVTYGLTATYSIEIKLR